MRTRGDCALGWLSSGIADVIADPSAGPSEAVGALLRERADLASVLDDLAENERLVLRHRFGLEADRPETLETIGRRLGLTRERVRQIEAAGLQKLRALLALARRLDAGLRGADSCSRRESAGRARRPEEDAMMQPKVVRLEQTEIVKFGPGAHYQPILGDDEGTTPIRTGIQTSQPGYVAPMHSHPYLEVLHILDGTAEAWVEGGEDRKVLLKKGDTVALAPNVPHSFRVVGDEVLRLLGTHVAPRRIVDYKDGGKTDARGYRVDP